MNLENTSLPHQTKDKISFFQFLINFILEALKQDPKMKWRFFCVFLFTGLTICFDVMAPLFLKNVIAALIEQKAAYSIFFYLGLSYGFAWGLGQLSKQLREIFSFPIIEGIVRNFTRIMFHKSTLLPMSYYYSQQTGTTINTFRNAQDGFPYLFSAVFFYFLPTLIEILIICLVLSTILSFQFVIIFFSMLLAYSIFSLWALGKQTKLQNESYERTSKAQSYLVDALLNIETIKTFCKQDYETNKIDKFFKISEKARLKSAVFTETVRLGQAFILGISLILLTLVGIISLTNKHIQIEGFVLVNAYFIQLTSPLDYFSIILKDIKDGFVSLVRAYQLMCRLPEGTNSFVKEKGYVREGKVEIKNINFQYNKDRPILHDITLSLAPQKVVALVGETGSGKSTIAKLLFRFVDSSSGNIFIDEKNINTIPLDVLRKSIGYVTQDPVLFHNTIFYNLTYGNPEATEKQIQIASDKAHLTTVINKLPDGYNTIVGERGVMLSGGERQRLALARTFLMRRKIYIFDEASSALDNETQNIVLQSIFSLSEEASVLLISHRLSSVEKSDEIVVLSNGRIIERGNHSQLLAQKQKYFTLWSATEPQDNDLSEVDPEEFRIGKYSNL